MASLRSLLLPVASRGIPSRSSRSPRGLWLKGLVFKRTLWLFFLAFRWAFFFAAFFFTAVVIPFFLLAFFLAPFFTPRGASLQNSMRCPFNKKKQFSRFYRERHLHNWPQAATERFVIWLSCLKIIKTPRHGHGQGRLLYLK